MSDSVASQLGNSTKIAAMARSASKILKPGRKPSEFSRPKQIRATPAQLLEWHATAKREGREFQGWARRTLNAKRDHPNARKGIRVVSKHVRTPGKAGRKASPFTKRRQIRATNDAELKSWYRAAADDDRDFQEWARLAFDEASERK